MISRLEKGKFPVLDSNSSLDWPEYQIREVASKMRELIKTPRLLRCILHTPALNDLGISLQILDKVPVQLKNKNTAKLLQTLKTDYQRLIFICDLPFKSVSTTTGCPPLLEQPHLESELSIAQLIAKVLGVFKRVMSLIELELKTAYRILIGKLYTGRISRLQRSFQRAKLRIDKFERRGNGIPRSQQKTANSLQIRIQKLEYWALLNNAQLQKTQALAKSARVEQGLSGKDLLLAGYLQSLCHLRDIECKVRAEIKLFPTRPPSLDPNQVLDLLEKQEGQFIATASRVSFDLRQLRDARQTLDQLQDLISRVHQILN